MINLKTEVELRFFRFVIPANAGIQNIFCFFDEHFTNGIPAFAGMTNLKCFFKIHPMGESFLSTMNTKTEFYQCFALFLEKFNFRF